MGQLITMDQAISKLATEEEAQDLINALYLSICSRLYLRATPRSRDEMNNFIEKYFDLINDNSQIAMRQITWRFLKHINGTKYGEFYEW